MAKKTVAVKAVPKGKAPTAKASAPSSAKRSYVRQSDIPRIGLTKSIRVAQAMYDSFAGKSAMPHRLRWRWTSLRLAIGGLR
jgi:hypothetical protein